jgi:hypothetical protein
MSKFWNDAGRIIFITVVLFISACSQAPAPTPTETPTPTKQPSPTPQPTKTPTEAPSPTQPIPQVPTLAITATLPSLALTPTKTAVALATGPAQTVADQYLFVSQNIADGSTVSSGESIHIVWTVKNVGKTTWTTKYMWRYFAGVKPETTVYYFPKNISNGQSIDVDVVFTAPSTAGKYSTWWKLTNDQGQNFGDISFAFVVK